MNEYYIFEDIKLADAIPVRYFFVSIEETWAHWHKEIEILFLLTGELQITIENAKYNLVTGDIILINSNQIHSIKGRNNLILVLQFVPEVISRVCGNEEFHQFNLNTVDSNLEKKTIDKMKSILAKIGMELSKNSEGYKFYLWSYVYELVGYIFRYCPYETVENDIKTEDLKKVGSIIKYINENYVKCLSIKVIAEALNMCDLTLSKFFKKKTGLSILFYLQIVRINHAKSLLKSNASIVDIAQDCGFNSLPTFYRVFKNLTGISPLEYKKSKTNNEAKNDLEEQGYSGIDHTKDYSLLYKYLEPLI